MTPWGWVCNDEFVMMAAVWRERCSLDGGVSKWPGSVAITVEFDDGRVYNTGVL